MRGSRSKITSKKNLVRQRWAEGFSGVKGLMGRRRFFPVIYLSGSKWLRLVQHYVNFHYHACVRVILHITNIGNKTYLSVCKATYNFCRSHSILINMSHRTYNAGKNNILT
jgi:hypothetical protein